MRQSPIHHQEPFWLHGCSFLCTPVHALSNQDRSLSTRQDPQGPRTAAFIGCTNSARPEEVLREVSRVWRIALACVAKGESTTARFEHFTPPCSSSPVSGS